MRSTENPLKQLTMGRRGFLAGTALGMGAGLSTHAIVSCVATEETSEISVRDQDLPFIGTEETFSTHELMVLNDRPFLEDTGLAELGPRRIGAMDEAGINVQIISAHTPGVQNVPGRKGIDFAYRLNRMLVDGPMAAYPGRFEVFATLPLQSPEASADELERTVQEDGFLGCLTNGSIGKISEGVPGPGSQHLCVRMASGSRHPVPPNGHFRGIGQESQAPDHHRPYGRGASVLLQARRGEDGRSDGEKPGQAVRAVF